MMSGFDIIRTHLDPESELEGPRLHHTPTPIVGDVIGNTAYSERFVLGLLVKFANLKEFKRIVEQELESFQDDTATLWEMSAEKDVVLFLLMHNALDIFRYALASLKDEHVRIREIVIGIVANMCCVKRVVPVLLKNQNLFFIALGNMKSDYPPGIVQTLRMINHCLYLTEEKDRHVIMKMFEEFEYTEALCFILKNSANRDLLITALECFNTTCEYLNIKSLRKDFFKQFVTPEVLESVSVAFNEIMSKHRKSHGGDQDSLERILAITLQIGLNLVWFDMNTPQIYTENKWSVVTMISQILGYYEQKIVHNKAFDTDLEHIVHAANMILTSLNISEITEPKRFFFSGYKIWKAIKPKRNKYNQPLTGEKAETADRSLAELCDFMCTYMAQCSEENFDSVIEVIDKDYSEIIRGTKNLEFRDIIKTRSQEAKMKKNLSQVKL